ncbi:MAG: hypothetical protein AB7O26_14140 [Planctomycetaceae bacterium]
MNSSSDRVESSPLIPSLASERIASLDQFRGYTVAGMILVNFIGGFAAVHSVFKHNNDYLSYADTIMPSFHFAVGFAYRLTLLRRLQELGPWKTYWSYIRRSFALIFVSILFFGIGGRFAEWSTFEKLPETMGGERSFGGRRFGGEGRFRGGPRGGDRRREELAEMSPDERRAALREAAQARKEEEKKRQSAEAEKAAKRADSWKDPEFRKTFYAQWRVWLARELKTSMWNTFAIIGATQLVVLPFVARAAWVRVLAMFGFGIGHALLTYWFNWGFVMGDENNWMVQLWKTGSGSSFDGGFFGPLCWSVVMLAGTLAFDLYAASPTLRRAGVRLIVCGLALTAFSYGVSCLTRLYDVEGVEKPAVSRDDNIEIAESPIVPDFDLARGRSFQSLLAEPPFVAPPPADERLPNYWMMSKRIPTFSFIFCAAGFAFLLYGAFVFLCDVWGLRLGVFRTFGLNPLAAYCIHSVVSEQIDKLMPRDAPLWYCVAGFATFFGATYLCVRFLEKRQLFIRL